MADRLPQYPMGPNFGAGMIPQQHQLSHSIQQQQQQPGLQQDSHRSMSAFPDQNPLWSQMQLQQMRTQGDRNQMAELLRTQNMVRQQQQQQFGLGMSGINGGAVSGQQQSFMDQSNQNQSHMGLGFPNMSQNPSFQQSMHNRNTMLQTLQNTQGHNRQLELMNMAQNQQNQNGPLNLTSRGPSQAGPNVPPTMNQPAHTEMFPSSGMNPNDAMRRSSPAQPMPGTQPQINNPAQTPNPAMRLNRETLQSRLNATRDALAATDLAITNLQSQRTALNDAVYLARMRQLQGNKVSQTQMLEKMVQALNNFNNISLQQSFNVSNVGQTNSWIPNNSSQPSFGQGPSQPTNHLQSNLQSSPSQPHPQTSHGPPRPGPNQLGPPFHNQSNPNFPINRMNSQQPPNNGAGAGNMPPNAANPNQPSVPMMSFNIPPLEKSRFEASFKTWCQTKSILIDQRMLNIDGRPIDLYTLHSSVIREGGLGNVQAKDLWTVIGGRLGFVQFPGSGPADPPKSGPAAAQQLAHVYKEYLAAFDAVYIASLENRRKQQLSMRGGNAQAGTGGFSPKNWNPSQLRVILGCADKSVEQLRAQGLPDSAIQFIDTHRSQLQQMIADQSSFRDIIRPNPGTGPSGQPFDNNLVANRPSMGQFPPQPVPNQPHGNPGAASQFPMQPTSQFPVKGMEQQQQPPPHNGPGPPFRLNRELLNVAHASIGRIKSEIARALPMMPNVEVSSEQRMEYNDLLERVNRQAGEFEPKLHVYYAITKNEEHIKKLIHSIVIVQHQRLMLGWSNPRFILSLDMLRQYHGQISTAIEQLSIGLRGVMSNQGPNPNIPQNGMPPRPPPQGFPAQPEPSSSPQVAPIPSPSQSVRPPPVPNALPGSRKQPTSAGPSPVVAPTPTPPPVTPVAAAATPTNTTAASPQTHTPKSPKTKVKAKAKAPPRRPSVKSSPAAAPPEPPQPAAPSAGTKRPLEVEAPSPNAGPVPATGPGPSSSNLVSNEPSPPKRMKTEWDEELSDELKKKTEAVENIKTDEDASNYFEKTMSELRKMTGTDGQASLTSDISDTLDMILKNYGEMPEPGPSSDLALSIDSGSAGPGLPLNEELGQYFDFSSFAAPEDDELESKAETPELISSSSTNPSPESGSEVDATHISSLSDPKLDDFSDPLRLGTLKEIDGGESAFYQSSDWKWDMVMPTVDQPWAIF
ncbi:hypothetical protein D9758_003807 [Tetrapyrgos nigripes]|uniref:ARID domain-containing protein n=1 Tax=Tetrapyrgos nigripes TaxID=182062 RepID=A0A8H5GLZ4_9AGAR|nr:hypothetical protein D9758_003807 [Tetrapyrgos nigripes]